MAEVTANTVKELREKTGAGMMDCKKALAESNGDMEKAIDWLRKKGLASAAKKSGRVASQGLVGVTSSGKEGAVIEVNSETDFVSRNDLFQNYVKDAVTLALKEKGDFEKIKKASMGAKNAEDTLVDLVAKIGENMNMRRSGYLKVDNGYVASYMHSAVAPNLGKIGVLVALESNADQAKLQEVGKQVAMHVAAANPSFLNIESVDSASLEREKAIFSDQAKASGKPANIIEKMVEGRVRKYYEEVVLVEQVYVIDPNKKVKDVLGSDIKITGYLRFALGEGIEKKQEDFAAEVAAATKK